jgi:hypothetical protein
LLIFADEFVESYHLELDKVYRIGRVLRLSLAESVDELLDVQVDVVVVDDVAQFSVLDDELYLVAIP